MNNKKAIDILESAKIQALNKAVYYTPKNVYVAQLWKDKHDAYEMARVALIKAGKYDNEVYGD